MSVVSFDKIIKILLKKGGYPSEFVTTLITFLGMSRNDFFKSIIAELGEEGAEIFFQKTIRNLSRDDEHFTFEPTEWEFPITNGNFFIEIDLSQAEVDVNTQINCVIIQNWGFGDSNLEVGNEDGDTFEGTIEEVWKWLLTDDPYSESELFESLETMIESRLQEVLGVRVFLERKKVRD
jgi:hypothetical protein